MSMQGFLILLITRTVFPRPRTFVLFGCRQWWQSLTMYRPWTWYDNQPWTPRNLPASASWVPHPPKTSLCNPSCPGTRSADQTKALESQRSACLCFLSTEIKGVSNHCPSTEDIFKQSSTAAKCDHSWYRTLIYFTILTFKFLIIEEN